MIYYNKFRWVQPYYGWIEWQEQVIEQQLLQCNFPEANLVIAKAKST